MERRGSVSRAYHHGHVQRPRKVAQTAIFPGSRKRAPGALRPQRGVTQSIPTGGLVAALWRAVGIDKNIVVSGGSNPSVLRTAPPTSRGSAWQVHSNPYGHSIQLAEEIRLAEGHAVVPENGVGDNHMEVDIRDNDFRGVIHGTHALAVVHEGGHGFASLFGHTVG